MATLVDDTFVDTIGTHLESHVIAPTNTVGAVWLKVLGDIQTIVSPSAGAIAQGQNAFPFTDPIGGNAGTLYVLDSTVGDCTISTSTPSENLLGIAFRYVDSTNFWFLILSGGVAYLEEVTGGVGTYHSTSVTNDGTIRVVLSGTSIQYGSNALEGSYTSSAHQAATKHGLFQDFGSAGVWSEFKVEGAVSPPPPPPPTAQVWPYLDTELCGGFADASMGI